MQSERFVQEEQSGLELVAASIDAVPTTGGFVDVECGGDGRCVGAGVGDGDGPCPFSSRNPCLPTPDRWPHLLFYGP